MNPNTEKSTSPAVSGRSALPCSPTPETDAEINNASNIALESTCGKLSHPDDIYVVPAEFCRNMERERNEAEKRSEKYESALRDILRYASQDSCEFHRLETIEDLAACF